MFLQSCIRVGEDHSLFSKIVFERSIDDFAFELSLHAGQELLFRFRDAKFVKGIFDFLRNIVPAASLLIRGLQVVVDVLEVDVDVTAPIGVWFGFKDLQAFQPEISHPLGLILHL